MLTSAQEARAVAALDLAERNAREAEALAPGIVDGTWAWLIGADSTAAALRTNARSTRTLADTLQEKLDHWRATGSPPVEDVEVADFERSARATDNAAAREAADLLKPSTALKETAKPPSLDVTPWWVWALIVLLVLVLFLPFILTALGMRRAVTGS